MTLVDVQHNSYKRHFKVSGFQHFPRKAPGYGAAISPASFVIGLFLTDFTC